MFATAYVRLRIYNNVGALRVFTNEWAEWQRHSVRRHEEERSAGLTGLKANRLLKIVPLGGHTAFNNLLLFGLSSPTGVSDAAPDATHANSTYGA
ncbi:hypothetical protein RE428_40160 [Marinobacter nanhaiticus D15-8W]|nr:hypothetical protein RE428_40160 [Marinobacter nanhaiticus D15-8W]